MPKKKVFVSFDFDHDFQLKASLLGQARLQDSPFSINDYSLKEAYPEPQWVSRAQQAISRSDVVIVLLGGDTHSAPGVAHEVRIAQGYRKPIFQLRPQGTQYAEVKGAGPVYVWKWKNIKAALG